MDNYEAIMKMDREHLAAFLDDVYVTGLNNGMYAVTKCSEDEQDAVLDEFPYGEEWLATEAEAATLHKCDKDGDDFILTASAKSALRLAGIDPDKE